MFNRYNNYNVLVNNASEYSAILDRKKLNFLRQYPTFSFKKLRDIAKSDLSYVFHQVQPFEKLYNISQQYYNSPEFGWIICYTNNLKSELQIYPGMQLFIYLPIDAILEML